MDLYKVHKTLMQIFNDHMRHRLCGQDLLFDCLLAVCRLERQ